MSLQSALSKDFKNLGHALATAAKYTAIGLKDVLVYANKAQVIEPEVEAVVGALAGPAGSSLTSLAFHAFGSVAAALEPLSADATAQAVASGLNVQLDVQTINDFKAAIPQLKAILVALGKGLPAAAAVAAAPPVVPAP